MGPHSWNRQGGLGEGLASELVLLSATVGQCQVESVTIHYFHSVNVCGSGCVGVALPQKGEEVIHTYMYLPVSQANTIPLCMGCTRKCMVVNSSHSTHAHGH